MSTINTEGEMIIDIITELIFEPKGE